MDDIKTGIDGAEEVVVDADRTASESSETKAEELEAEARRLASLDIAQRAIERKAVAKQFDVTVGVIDDLIKRFIPMGENTMTTCRATKSYLPTRSRGLTR